MSKKMYEKEFKILGTWMFSSTFFFEKKNVYEYNMFN